MTRRFHTSGNSRPWAFDQRWQDRPRVPGPIEPMDRPGWLRRIFGRG
jgi:hypothetical protein